MECNELESMDKAAEEAVAGNPAFAEKATRAVGGGAKAEVKDALRAAGLSPWVIMLLGPLIEALLQNFDAQKVIDFILERLGLKRPA